MNTIFIVEFDTKPECLADFEAVMRQVKHDLPRAEGCKGVEIMQNQTDITRLVVIEKWTDQAAHQHHVNSLKKAGVWDDILTLLSSEPKGEYYQQL